MNEIPQDLPFDDITTGPVRLPETRPLSREQLTDRLTAACSAERWLEQNLAGGSFVGVLDHGDGTKSEHIMNRDTLKGLRRVIAGSYQDMLTAGLTTQARAILDAHRKEKSTLGQTAQPATQAPSPLRRTIRI